MKVTKIKVRAQEARKSLCKAKDQASVVQEKVQVTEALASQAIVKVVEAFMAREESV